MASAALARGIAEPATDTPDVPRVLGDPFLFGTFAVTEDFAQKRPAHVRALAAALDEAIAMISADATVGTAAMKPYVRETERPFVDRYPAARYLRSGEIGAAQLDRALELSGTDVRAATVALPCSGARPRRGGPCSAPPRASGTSPRPTPRASFPGSRCSATWRCPASWRAARTLTMRRAHSWTGSSPGSIPAAAPGDSPAARSRR